jgi:hypothetical protein
MGGYFEEAGGYVAKNSASSAKIKFKIPNQGPYLMVD